MKPACKPCGDTGAVFICGDAMCADLESCIHTGEKRPCECQSAPPGTHQAISQPTPSIAVCADSARNCCICAQRTPPVVRPALFGELCTSHAAAREALGMLEVVPAQRPTPPPEQGPLCLVERCGEERLGASAFCWCHRAEWMLSREWVRGLESSECLALEQAAFAARLARRAVA